MNRRVLAGLLAVAAALVMVENWIYLRGTSGIGRPLRPSVDLEIESALAAEEPPRGERTPSTAPPHPISAEELAAVVAQLERERSPFLLEELREISVQPRTVALPRLAGTLVGSDRRVAWMDGRPRTEGESYGEFVVSRIERDRVVLARNGRLHTLEVATGPGPSESTP
jgi:hypothetical protein